MKRRTFLKQTAVASAAAIVGPAILHADDKAGTKKPIIGEGEHRFECTHDWGTLPKHLNWETTHGVCVDKEGLIYIKHQGHGRKAMDTILVFDRDGLGFPLWSSAGAYEVIP